MYVPFPVNMLSKQKYAMRCGLKKPQKVKEKRYYDSMIYLNDYLSAFPGANASDKIDEM